MCEAFEPTKKSGCVTDGERLLGLVVLMNEIFKVIVEEEEEEDETTEKQAKNYV